MLYRGNTDDFHELRGDASELIESPARNADKKVMGTVCSRIALRSTSLGRAILPRPLTGRVTVRLRFTEAAEYRVFVLFPSMFRWLREAAILMIGAAAVAGLICWISPAFR